MIWRLWPEFPCLWLILKKRRQTEKKCIDLNFLDSDGFNVKMPPGWQKTVGYRIFWQATDVISSDDYRFLRQTAADLWKNCQHLSPNRQCQTRKNQCIYLQCKKRPILQGFAEAKLHAFAMIRWYSNCYEIITLLLFESLNIGSHTLISIYKHNYFVRICQCTWG